MKIEMVDGELQEGAEFLADAVHRAHRRIRRDSAVELLADFREKPLCDRTPQNIFAALGIGDEWVQNARACRDVAGTRAIESVLRELRQGRLQNNPPGIDGALLLFTLTLRRL